MKFNSKSGDPSRRRTGRLLLAALAVAGVGGLAMAFLLPSGRPAGAEPAIPPGVSITSWLDNGEGGQHVLQVADGNANVPLAGVRVSGTVATDTNCTPDAQGLSHCHNRIDIDGGRSVEVIHTHLMSRHPCLRPGQRVSITGLNADWVIASEGQRWPVN